MEGGKKRYSICIVVVVSFPIENYCSACDLNFEFKSKYMRHLQSERHKLYALANTTGDLPEPAIIKLVTIHQGEASSSNIQQLSTMDRTEV